MSKGNKYSAEVREGAVRLVYEARKDYPTLWLAIQSIAAKIGCASSLTFTIASIHFSIHKSILYVPFQLGFAASAIAYRP